MILDKQEFNSDSNDPGYGTVLLVQVHGEYGVTQEEIRNIGSYLSETLVWNDFAISQLSEALGREGKPDDYGAEVRDRMGEAFEVLFPGLTERLRSSSGWGFDPESDSVIEVQGRAKELDEYFEALASSFNPDTLSGDDDAFDYWPNDFAAMLEPLARDLDEMFPRSELFPGQDMKDRVTQVEEIWVEVITRTWGPGRIDEEWGPDPDNPGQYRKVAERVAQHWSPTVEELVTVEGAPEPFKSSFEKYGVAYEDWEKKLMERG